MQTGVENKTKTKRLIGSSYKRQPDPTFLSPAQQGKAGDGTLTSSLEK